MISGGFYLKARCIQNAEISEAPPHVREIWDWLLKEANFKDLEYMGTVIKRGSCFTSYQEIRDGLKWSIGYRIERYSKSQCETAIKYLIKHGMIITNKTARGLIVTICKYEEYQDPKNYEITNVIKNERSLYENHTGSHTENHTGSHTGNHGDTVVEQGTASNYVNNGITRTTPEATPGTTPGTTRKRQQSETISKNDKERKNKEEIKDKANFAFSLPDDVDPVIWDAFIEHRTKNQKKLTEYAKHLLVKKLEGIGQDKNAVLNQSIEKGWAGLFPLKAEGGFNGTGNYGRRGAGQFGAQAQGSGDKSEYPCDLEEVIGEY